MTAAFQPGDIPADFQLSLLSYPQIESPIILRPYQQTIKDEVYNQLNQGIHRILVYSPTGSGKTATFCSMIADFLASRHRVLLLMHREFLIEQTVKTLMRFAPKVSLDFSLGKVWISFCFFLKMHESVSHA